MPDRTLRLESTLPLTGGPAHAVAGPAAPSSVLPAEIAARYSIRRVLGRGSFGIVYLAEDRRLGRLVAIKQLFAADPTDLQLGERFLQEARIAGQLEHPNVIIVYNIEGDGHSACIIMEYLGGGSLQDVLAREGRLSIRVAGRVMLGIMAGLQAAHGIMVVHRDIKPQNILFGIGTTPKISDFGIAHLPASAGGSLALEQTDQSHASIVGSPLYMSPDQVLKLDIDARSDLYSAGVIFYQMLAGRPPLASRAGMSMAEIAEEIIRGRPTRLRKFRPDCPRALEDVAMCLLEKNRDNRCADAAEVIKALVAGLRDAPREKFAEDEIAMPVGYQVGQSPGTLFEDIVSLLLIDGEITPAERLELELRAERLGLSLSQAQAIEEKVRRRRGLAPPQSPQVGR